MSWWDSVDPVYLSGCCIRASSLVWSVGGGSAAGSRSSVCRSLLSLEPEQEHRGQRWRPLVRPRARGHRSNSPGSPSTSRVAPRARTCRPPPSTHRPNSACWDKQDSTRLKVVHSLCCSSTRKRWSVDVRSYKQNRSMSCLKQSNVWLLTLFLRERDQRSSLEMYMCILSARPSGDGTRIVLNVLSRNVCPHQAAAVLPPHLQVEL